MKCSLDIVPDMYWWIGEETIITVIQVLEIVDGNYAEVQAVLHDRPVTTMMYAPVWRRVEL